MVLINGMYVENPKTAMIPITLNMIVSFGMMCIMSLDMAQAHKKIARITIFPLHIAKINFFFNSISF